MLALGLACPLSYLSTCRPTRQGWGAPLSRGLACRGFNPSLRQCPTDRSASGRTLRSPPTPSGKVVLKKL
eukprot:14029999-Alexandrium_andersonii.AAC.1